MKYSVDINRSVEDLAYCLKRVNDEVNDIYDWRISINAGGIDYGIYFNFDIDNKELEICNQPRYDDTLYLDTIINKINGYDEDYDED